MSLIWLIVGGVIGYLLGQRSAKPDATPDFKANPELQHDMSNLGHKMVEEKIAKRKARIMSAAQEKGRITNDDVEDLFCISDATARRYLDDLENEGKLAQEGSSGQGVFYTAK